MLWPPPGYGTCPHLFMYLQGGFAELAKIVFGFFAGEVSLTSVAVRAIYSGSAENLFFVCSVN